MMKVSVCSGAGIVYDSVPENEYQECLNKAGAVIERNQIWQMEELTDDSTQLIIMIVLLITFIS